MIAHASSGPSGTQIHLRVLEGLRERRGLPQQIVVDNGTEFTSWVVDQWAFARSVELHFITPGQPTENAFTWIRRILLFKKGPQGPSNAGEKVLMVL